MANHKAGSGSTETRSCPFVTASEEPDLTATTPQGDSWKKLVWNWKFTALDKKFTIADFIQVKVAWMSLHPQFSSTGSVVCELQPEAENRLT
jgi:hypothetical protein